MSAAPKLWAFDVDAYLRMIEVGILNEDDPVELLEGKIVEMAAVGTPHFGCVNRLNFMMVRTLGERAVIHPQNPIRLGDYSMPEPDLAVLKPSATFYADRYPTPEDTLLLVEVSDTTLRKDRTAKTPIYARHGIPEVWIVALEKEWVEVYRQPEAAGYALVRQARRGEVISPEAFPDVELAVSDILG